jgi:D-amino-acid oxidase
MPIQESPKHIIILGAGTTGLQTALSLLTSPSTSNFTVTIIACHVPGDLHEVYTSPWAGGHWRSHVGFSDEEAEVRSFDKRTYEYWMELLSKSDEHHDESMQEKEKRIGLGIRESRNYWGKESFETAGLDGSGIWWRDLVQNFTVLDLPKLREQDPNSVPEGAIFGIKYQSICINVPRYLEYLFERVKGLGARVIKAEVQGGRGRSAVKDILLSKDKSVKKEEIVGFINCAGLVAGDFVPSEEEVKLYPIRGQTILVRGEAKWTQTYVGVPGWPDSELLYVVPRPGSGTTILGGCKRNGDWNGDVDAALNKRILEGVVRYGLIGREGLTESRTGEEEGREDGNGKERDTKEGFEVISTQVGYRPGRVGGPRVEVEGNKRGEKVDGLWVVHAYGHAGGGYQASVGSAEKVVRLVSGLME